MGAGAAALARAGERRGGDWCRGRRQLRAAVAGSPEVDKACVDFLGGEAVMGFAGRT